MAARNKAQAKAPPMPPSRQDTTIIHGDQPTIQHWLTHYAQKLSLPEHELALLAITQDRQEFVCWTGKRLNLMVLGCYCYIPAPLMAAERQRTPGPAEHRHIIFIEPTMQPKSIEVTTAHELIHLADRINGTPRR